MLDPMQQFKTPASRSAWLQAMPLLLLALLADTRPGAAATPEEELRAGFVHPPDSARPWVYWFWVDGNVTRAGITADLEAMARAGIGGVVLFDVTQEVPPGPVRFFSPEWRALFKHAVVEAGRLGLQVSLHNAAGWTGSGGPWITPELAMQKVVSSRTNLLGPARFSGPLPRLPDPQSRPIATLAFPTLVGEGAPVPGFAPKVTASVTAGFEGAKLLDGNPATFVTLPAPRPHGPQFLQLEFAEPFTASTLKLAGTAQPQNFQGTLQVSDDGRAFRDLREFMSARSGVSLPFEQVSARYFRVLLTKVDPGLSRLEFSELELAPSYRIELFQARAGLGPLPSEPPAPLPHVPAEALIAPERVLDLTSNTGPDGHLTWDILPGRWTVLRLAHAPVGTMNHPARPDGAGLECDKLSRAAIEKHFDSFLRPLAAEAGDAAGHAFSGIHIDSWEIAFQNWTPHFPEEFRQRRGYDPLRFLPALTGRFVGSSERSERFLWDIRRTIADLLADNYAGHLAELAHRFGLQLSVQGYGSLGKGPFDDLQYAARADLPMTEFWRAAGAPAALDLKSMPSAAHTWGKPVVPAESFTSYPAGSGWLEHPFALKALGDAAFCEGVNRIVFHRYAHQPWLDRAPGMTMGPWGLHYERTQTWWEQSRAWHQYLARCQFLLQRGLFVADLCYLTREGAYTEPPTRDTLAPPAGYDYDFAAPEVALSRMTSRDGRVILPDGMSYRILVLPGASTSSPASNTASLMTPKLLRKLKQLVETGATLIGPRPVQSPSLEGYPQCDAEVARLAAELWGACDGKSVKENRFGKGTVVWGRPPAEVLAQAGVPPDFQPMTKIGGLPWRWIHRRVNDADFYFVANPNPRPVQAECRFRVTGKRPEFWHPDTGKIERPAVWLHEQSGTVIPLRLDPAGSVFVAFLGSSNGVNPIAGVTRNGQADASAEVTFTEQGKLELLSAQTGDFSLKTASGKTLVAQVKSPPEPMPLAGKWQLSLPSRSGAPKQIALDKLVSWTAFDDPGVKYFAGTATYTQSFHLPPEFLSPQRRCWLDLGQVEVIAELNVNGHNLGVLWKPPFEADVTEALKPGDNVLEIKVTNLWPNRLIGDEQLPDDCQWSPNGYGAALLEWPKWLLEDKPSPTGRQTFATAKLWTKDSPLLPSGLLGPVTLRAAERVKPE
jgi:hypothetical protein